MSWIKSRAVWRKGGRLIQLLCQFPARSLYGRKSFSFEEVWDGNQDSLYGRVFDGGVWFRDRDVGNQQESVHSVWSASIWWFMGTMAMAVWSPVSYFWQGCCSQKFVQTNKWDFTRVAVEAHWPPWLFQTEAISWGLTNIHSGSRSHKQIVYLDGALGGA